MSRNAPRQPENTKKCALPFFSIVIPVYNAEKYLRECLDSILAQTFADFEVIVVDDGSQDMSSSICTEYAAKDSRIRYFRKENGGSYQSRLYGAERTTGTYITFCDADDYYATKDIFSLLHDNLVQEKCSALQFGLCAKYNHLKHSITLVDHAVTLDREQFLSLEYPNLLCSHWKNARLTPSLWNKVYHRSLLEHLPGGDTQERIFWGDDLITNLHLLEQCNSFRLIPEIGYCYRMFSGGHNRFSPRDMMDLDKIKQYQLLFLERYHSGQIEEIRNTLFFEVADWFFYFVQQALGQLNETEVEKLIVESLSLPHFVLAREYYLHAPAKEGTAINLLRNADAKEYILKANRLRKKFSVKKAVVKLLKRIYAWI